MLVDLAMISAEGQGDLEVARVSCLHAAVTGYAPLIYDLDRKMDFKGFIHLCELVWRALEADPKLASKLVRKWTSCESVLMINIVCILYYVIDESL